MSLRPRGRPLATDTTTLSTEHLLDRALDVFAERGYEGMSVRELARELGVSHNLIPQRIGTKEQLWFAAVDRGFSALAVAIAGLFQTWSDDDDDLVKLRSMMARFVEVNSARPALLRIITQEAGMPGPRLDHIFDNYIKPVGEFGQEVLDRLADEGRIRTRNVPLMYFLMTHGGGGPMALPALAERFGHAIDPNDAAAVHAHAEEFATIIFEGLVNPSN